MKILKDIQEKGEMCADRAYPCFLYLRNGQNHGMIFLAQILPAGSLMV